MRLVDADQMAFDESEAYMATLPEIDIEVNQMINFAVHKKVQMIIADTPTVDAVIVVRCDDCKYGDQCTFSEKGWFCADGERKDA